MAGRESDKNKDNVIPLKFLSYTDDLEKIDLAKVFKFHTPSLPVELTGTTGATGGWFSNTEKVLQEFSDALLADPIGDMFSGFDIGIFDKINDITGSALLSAEKLREALRPYSGDLGTFFSNVQKFRQHCNGLISFPTIHEVPSKHGDLDNVRFLLHRDSIDLNISRLKSNHKRLFCRKVYYVVRILANIIKKQDANQTIEINTNDFLVQSGKINTAKKAIKPESLSQKKYNTKRSIKDALKVIDSNSEFISDNNDILLFKLSVNFLREFVGEKKPTPQTFIPWLLKIDSEYTFILAEKAIAQYTNIANSERDSPNYDCLTYKTLFRHICGDSKRANRKDRYRCHKIILESIQYLVDHGYIKATWYKGKTSLKSAKPDNHEEALGCKLKFTIPKFDSYKESIKHPLPHQKS